MNTKSDQKGKVILAGAGPGDPELITLKTLRFLHEADVVITDRLVSPALLSQHVKAGAPIFFVGKQGGSEKSVPQESINDLLVAQALENRLVVRLKGGDVAFFSNVLDELNTLHAHGIPYEIVPGITAASGASACGIPLTARGYATSVRFLTLYNPEKTTQALWEELANTSDTLVLYMSSAALPELVKNLVAHRIASEKLLAVIEQATTPFQQVHIHNLYHQSVRDASNYKSPTLIIVGRVVGLFEKFKWRQPPLAYEDYFKTLDHFLCGEQQQKEIYSR